MDAADIAADLHAARIADEAARAAAPLVPGVAGECDQCEWWMPRLVGGLCAFCRDGRRRPDDWDPPVPPDPPAAPPAQSHHKEPEAMPAKTVQLPASAQSAIDKVEALAAAKGLTMGQAAAELIDRDDGPATVTATVDLATIGIDQLFEQLRAAFDARPDQSAEIAALTDRAEAAEARASAAEATLAQFKALLA